MRNSIYVLFILLLTSCNNTSEKIVHDFEFQFIGEVDSYNSSNGKFTRKSVTEKMTDTTVIEKLTPAELEKIYKSVQENKINTIPQTFECEESANHIVPSFTYTLIYKINGVARKLEYNGYCYPKTDADAEKRFLKILEEIREVVYKKTLIQKLPKTRMIFM